MSFVNYNSSIDAAYREPDALRDRFRSLFAKAAMAAASRSKAADPGGPPIQTTQRPPAEALAPTDAVGGTECERPPPPHSPDEGSTHTIGSTSGRAPKRLKHIKRVVDAKGIERLYYGRGGKPYIRLAGSRGSAAFRESYTAAAYTKTLIWEAAQKPVEPARSFNWLVDRYVCSANFQQLSPQTQRVYRRVLDRLLRCDGLGAKPVAGLTPAQIRRMLAKRRNTPAAASDALKKLRILMRFARELRWRSDDPTRGINLQQAADTADGRQPRRHRSTSPMTARRRRFSD